MAAAVQSTDPSLNNPLNTHAPTPPQSSEMLIARGQKLHGGAAMGNALVIKPTNNGKPDETSHGQGFDIELQRAERALNQAAEEFETNSREAIDPEVTKMIAVNASMARDQTHIKAIGAILKQSDVTAETALHRHFSTYADQFRAMKSTKYAPLALEVEQVLKVILSKLAGESESKIELTQDTIVVAQTLAPFELMRLLRSGTISGLVLGGCGKTSHTAIIAKSHHIPVVRGLDATSLVQNGDTVYVNGDSGEICINPDSSSLRKFASYIKNRSVQGGGLKLTDKKPTTLDGAQWTIRGTLSSHHDLARFAAAGFDGIGLFRTEDLFLGSEGVIPEDTQFAIYAKVLGACPGQSVTIRTFDLGADKWSPKLGKPQGDNAKLGKRGIRLCFAEMMDDFRAQARAILRAQALHGNARIMFPVVNDLDEFRRAKSLILEERDKLISEKVIDSSVQIQFGAMIETPSAVFMIKSILAEADFISIGSNDLTQYILATDREATVDSAHEPVEHHPAVLKSLHRIAKAAREANKPLSICGDMAGDTLYTPILVGLGITELSVVSADAPKVNFALSCLDTQRCKELAKVTRKLASADDALRMIQSFLATITAEQDEKRAADRTQ